MDFFCNCGEKAKFKCVCKEYLCQEHAGDHSDREEGHSFQLIRPKFAVKLTDEEIRTAKAKAISEAKTKLAEGEIEEAVNALINKLGISLYSHLRGITSIAFSASELSIATVGNDNALRVWEIEKKKTMMFLGCSGSQIASMNCVILTAANKYIITGEDDGFIKVWTPSQYQLTKILRHEEDSIVCLCSSNNYFISGSENGSLVVWNLEDFSEENNLKGHEKSVVSVKFTQDEQYFISAGKDSLVIIWNFFERNVETVVQVNSKIKAFDLSSDDKFFAVGDNTGNIQLWSLSSFSQINLFTGPGKKVTSLKISEDKTLLATGSADGVIRVWNIVKGKRCKSFTRHSGEVTCLLISKTNSFIVSTGSDSKILFWGLKKAEDTFEMPGHVNIIDCLAFSNDEKSVITCAGRTICSWDLFEGNLNFSLRNRKKQEIQSIDISSDDKFIATGCSEGKIVTWDIENQEEIEVLRGHTDDVRIIMFALESNFIISSDFNSIRVWDFNLQEQLWSFQCNHFNAISMINDQCMLSFDDYEVTLYNFVEGIKLAEIHLKKEISCLLFTENNKYLVLTQESAVTVYKTRNLLKFSNVPRIHNMRRAAQINFLKLF